MEITNIIRTYGRPGLVETVFSFLVAILPVLLYFSNLSQHLKDRNEDYVVDQSEFVYSTWSLKKNRLKLPTFLFQLTPHTGLVETRSGVS